MERPYILWTGKLQYPHEEDAYRLVYGYNSICCEASSTDAMNAESWVACPEALTEALKAAVLSMQEQIAQLQRTRNDASVAEPPAPTIGSMSGVAQRPHKRALKQYKKQLEQFAGNLVPIDYKAK